MPATAFHLSVVPMSRSTGKSSVAKAAYITGGKLADERTGKLHDYTRRGGVEAVLHAQLKDAPEWSRDIAQAWNAVEAVENRKNSQTAKVIDGLAFPHGIDAEARQRMLTDFMREQFGRKGLLWTASIHAPDKDGDQRNYHAHVMWSERPLTAAGFAKTKDREGTSFATREAALLAMRERWAALSAKQLERAGLPLEAARWKEAHRTLPEQEQLARARGDLEFATELADREPTKHLGSATVALERKGIPTERGDVWQATEARNDQRRALRQQGTALEREEIRLAAKEQRAADYHDRQTAATVRLYRGVGSNVSVDGSLNLDGVFFTTNRERAATFGTLHFVDVSREELARYQCPHSAHILHHEPAAKDDYRIADPAILARLRVLETPQAIEERRATQAANLAGLEDVQTLRVLWRSADNAAAFLTASQAQGFTVARVTAQDARQSRADAEATAGRDPSRSAPVYSKAELVAYNAQGFGFRLDGATLDDAKATERMEKAAGMKLPTLNEARQAVIDGQRDRQAEPAAQPKRNMASLARAAIGGLVEFLFGWLADRKPQQRGKPLAPRRNLATEAREASKRADKSLAGAQDIEANYGHRLLQLDPEIQDSLRRAREAEQKKRRDDERDRDR